MKGYVQVYTGNGKGKTTASFGLALRASGAGLKVFIGQFCKGQDYSELKAFKNLPNVILKQFGTPKFIFGKPSEEDYERASKAFNEVKKIIQSGDYDIVILDEANIAMNLGLISVDEFIDTIKKRPSHVEIVITGRNAPEEILEIADLVTEMKEIKHYYSKGVQARKGIEK